MTTKKKQNSKVPKSAKTRLTDLTPKNDARGGRLPVVRDSDVNPGLPPSGIATPPSASSTSKKHLTL